MKELLGLAEQVVDLARRAGATNSECTVAEGEEFSVNVRLGKVETLKQAASRSAGVRVLRGKRTGASYTSDFSSAGLDKMVCSALELAEITSDDPFAGMPDLKEIGSLPQDLRLFSEDLTHVQPSDRIDLATAAESAALSFDPRITNSEGGSFSSYDGTRVFANSLGFSGGYRATSCSLGCVPVARDGDRMERDYWYTSSRSLQGLEPASDVGKTAAERTVRRLGASKVRTRRVPVVFESRVARSFVNSLFEAVEGRNVYRGATFMAGMVGAVVANERVTLIDDGTIPGLFGTHPFDDEGVRTRRTPVIVQGVLRSYLLNSYSARKLGLRTTGSASRGITGNAAVGHGNFYLEAGPRSRDEIIAGIPEGFFVTELIGSGVNLATGDYSRGASGLWIENGKLAYPVAEVTVAGSVQEMLANLEPASDLEFRGSVASPTLCMGEMTVGGR